MRTFWFDAAFAISNLYEMLDVEGIQSAKYTPRDLIAHN